MGVSISYAITVCNENEVINLIKLLHKHKRENDKIFVLLDKPKCDEYLLNYLYRFSSSNWITLKESKFNGNFADWKNELNNMCDGDTIFNIDADEIPHTNLLESLPFVLEQNPQVDLFYVPRINILVGDTDEIKKYVESQRWSINENGWINWPGDYQSRIYKRNSNIKWDGQVHETITGYKTYHLLPTYETWALNHLKTLAKQIKQNELYSTL
jgi:hypothetical protein